MTLGRREYSEADMMRMQRDAEARVRDMQSRVRATVEQDNLPPPPRNRNWNMGPNTRRNNRRQQPQQAPRSEPRPAEKPPEVPPVPPAPPPQVTEPQAPKRGTIVEDIMGALGLDEDYLLIIGLMLILINQRADTTLILALAYLLI